MASPTQWIWASVSSRSWWWTGKPGILPSIGSWRVGHSWATELNWYLCPTIDRSHNLLWIQPSLFASLGRHHSGHSLASLLSVKSGQPILASRSKGQALYVVLLKTLSLGIQWRENTPFLSHDGRGAKGKTIASLKLFSKKSSWAWEGCWAQDLKISFKHSFWTTEVV